MGLAQVLGVVSLVFLAACTRAPSPLTPHLAGSVGMPHRGVLTDAAALPPQGPGWAWLRPDDRHWGAPRFVDAIARAAAKVAAERPGATLKVGDLSTRHGGRLLPHLSHRTGRDADLLLYLSTLGGVPVESPGFLAVGADGLAWDPSHKRFLRFDVEREWLLVKALVEDPEARVQWLFANRDVEAMLVEWARARGEPAETILRAQQAMLQPVPGGPHDDHIHVRTQCTADEVQRGCEATGPARSWISMDPAAATRQGEEDEELAQALLRPLGGG